MQKIYLFIMFFVVFQPSYSMDLEKRNSRDEQELLVLWGVLGGLTTREMNQCTAQNSPLIKKLQQKAEEAGFDVVGEYQEKEQ